MKKKLIAFVLLAAMVLGTVACGNNNQQPSQSAPASSGESKESSQAASSSEAEKPAEPTHITIWANTHMAAGQADEKAVIAAMNEYTKEKINVTFDYEIVNLSEKLQLELATTDNVDMWWGSAAGDHTSLVRGNAVLDITDMLDNYPTLKESMPQIVWDSVKYDGRIYCAPVMKESFAGSTYIIPVEVANKVKAEKGIDITAIMKEIKTVRDMDKLTEYLQAVKDVTGTEMAVVKQQTFATLMNQDPIYAMVQSGVVLDTTTGKMIDVYASQEYADYVAMEYDWNKRGFYSSEWAVGSLAGGLMNPYRKGEKPYGMTNWATTPDNANNAFTRYGVEVYALEIGERTTTSTSMLGSYYAISAKTKKADACMKFIELLLTDPYLADLYTFGIEGKHFTYNADGSVHQIPDSGWSNSIWTCTSLFTASVLETEDPAKKQIYEDENAQAVASPILGFRLDTTNVAAEVAALSSVQSEYERLLEYGFYDPAEYLPKFIAARKAAGVDKVIAEIQTQYDAWLKTK